MGITDEREDVWYFKPSICRIVQYCAKLVIITLKIFTKHIVHYYLNKWHTISTLYFFECRWVTSLKCASVSARYLCSFKDENTRSVVCIQWKIKRNVHSTAIVNCEMMTLPFFLQGRQNSFRWYTHCIIRRKTWNYFFYVTSDYFFTKQLVLNKSYEVVWKFSEGLSARSSKRNVRRVIVNGIITSFAYKKLHQIADDRSVHQRATVPVF